MKGVGRPSPLSSCINEGVGVCLSGAGGNKCGGCLFNVSYSELGEVAGGEKLLLLLWSLRDTDSSICLWCQYLLIKFYGKMIFALFKLLTAFLRGVQKSTRY